ncbi:MAG: hypothetical protein OQK98_09290 [Gammaproteobacteria bacterium]|nr:hypothetical protein [Gammaproteobacteria bacterium]
MTERTYTLDELKNIISKTDYERLKNMTDEEIEQAAKDDPDSNLPSDEELEKFKRVNPNDK